MKNGETRKEYCIRCELEINDENPCMRDDEMTCLNCLENDMDHAMMMMEDSFADRSRDSY